MLTKVRVTLDSEQVCIVTYDHGGALQVHLKVAPGNLRLIWERPSGTNYRFVSEEADVIAAEAIRVADKRRRVK